MDPQFWQNEYVSQEEMRREFKIAPSTEWRWNRLGIGPPRTYVGRKILFKTSDLRAWLERESKRRERKLNRRRPPSRQRAKHEAAD